MDIYKSAIAGTLESSDVQVTVSPYTDGIRLTLESTVINQYGKQIKQAVYDTLEKLNINNVDITVVDKGALDCTLKARIECAVFRSANGSEKDIQWGTLL